MRYSKVREVRSPERGTSKSAGIDFFVPSDNINYVLFPGQDALIPSGIVAEIPEGYMLMGADKSGVVTSSAACLAAGREPKIDAFPSSVIIGTKIVDEDFQGEIHIHVINVGTSPITIIPGMKIAQFILVPVSYAGLEEVPREELFTEKSERGDGCFGSTNK